MTLLTITTTTEPVLTKLQLLDIAAEDDLPADHELHLVPLARFLHDALVAARSQGGCGHVGQTHVGPELRRPTKHTTCGQRETYPGDPASGSTCAVRLHWIHKVRSKVLPARFSALFVVVTLVTVTHSSPVASTASSPECVPFAPLVEKTNKQTKTFIPH